MTIEQQPRDEAFVPDWPKDSKNPRARELDPEQYDVALGAHRLFRAMAARPFTPRSDGSSEFDSFLPRVDLWRSNHTVLVDGARGSGKTGVILRLLQDWGQMLQNRSVARLPKGATLKGEAEIVPVGLLDLEAVPKTANLATRIAGLFERIVSAIEKRGSKTEAPRSPTWATLDGSELASRAAWRCFVEAAALEWDRSVERRQTSIDLDSYVVEIEQAERRGLNAGERFRTFLDALVNDWSGWRPRSGVLPFFVVPIDDADLNPARTVELFELMRTLWHARVGFLLAGNSELFEHVLTTHFRQQIDTMKVGGPAAWGAFHIQLVPDEGRHAERLARDLYEKAVPVAQRLAIKQLHGSVRLSFLRDALARHVDSEIDESHESLVDCLSTDALAPLALPDRWRRLCDLRDLMIRGDFSVLGGSKQLVLSLWEQAVSDSPLDVEQKKRIKNYVTIDRYGDFRAMVYLRDADTRGHSRQHANFLGGEMYVGKPVLVLEDTDPESKKDIALNASVTAAALLARNHIYHKNWGTNRVELAASLVTNSFEIPFVYAGRPEYLQTAYVQFYWPIPGWAPYLEKQRLYGAWGRVIDAWRSGGGAGQLARDFLGAVLQSSKITVSGQPAWNELAEKLASTSAGDAVGMWARSYSGLLAAPESGLSPDDANVWLLALRKAFGAEWQDMRKELHLARRERAQQVLARMPRDENVRKKLDESKIQLEIDQLLIEFDRLASGFDWVAAVGGSRK